MTKDYNVTSKFTPFTNSTSSGVMPNQVKYLLFYRAETPTVALTLGHEIGRHDRATIKLSTLLNLQDFPVDRQMLRFTFDPRVPHPSKLPPRGIPARWANPCTCSVDSKVFATSQFRYYPPTYMCREDGTVSLCIGLERTLGMYKWTFFIPIFATTLMASMAMALPATDLVDRLSLDITLLLTVVAFNFSVKRPPVSYETFSDVYVGFAEALISVACAESCFAYYATTWMWKVRSKRDCSARR